MSQMEAPVLRSIQSLIQSALREDLNGQEDLTSQATIAANLSASVSMVAREPGTMCGIDVISSTFKLLDGDVRWGMWCLATCDRLIS